jgi:hypothetical protein
MFIMRSIGGMIDMVRLFGDRNELPQAPVAPSHLREQSRELPPQPPTIQQQQQQVQQPSQDDVRVVEQEINLTLLNSKLNYLISAVDTLLSKL